MSRWFQDRRQEFIAATLRQFGQIRRADLVRQFDVSVPQASNDIAEFMAAKPPHVRYDVSAKAYVLEDDARKAITSGELIAMLDDPVVKAAVSETRF